MEPSRELLEASKAMKMETGELPKTAKVDDVQFNFNFGLIAVLVLTVLGVGAAILVLFRNFWSVISSASLVWQYWVVVVLFIVLIPVIAILSFKTGSKDTRMREAQERLESVFKPFSSRLKISGWNLFGPAGEYLYFKLEGDDAAYLLGYRWMYKYVVGSPISASTGTRRIGHSGGSSLADKFGLVLERYSKTPGRANEIIRNAIGWTGREAPADSFETAFPAAELERDFGVHFASWANDLNVVSSGAKGVYARVSFLKETPPENIAKAVELLKKMSALAAGTG